MNEKVELEKEEPKALCETCKYAKFDELWGEWKCTKYSRRLHCFFLECKYYKKKSTD